MRKVVFGAGLAFSVAGVVFAGERSRGAGGDAVAGGVAAAVAPVITELAPGVGKMSVGGIEVIASADNTIDYATEMGFYGSIERADFNSSVIHCAMARDAEGAQMFSNGAIGFFSDLLGSNPPVSPAITSAEEYKSVMSYAEMTVGSETITLFANNAVFQGSASAEPEWSIHARTMMSSVNGNDAVYADGAVFSIE